MTISDEVLERIAPADADGWVPDWPEVLGRAERRRPSARRSKRRRLLVVALAAVVLIPFAGSAATRDWWFLGIGGTPTPTTAPIVVREGEWNGHAWDLVAYPSTTDGLCFGIDARDDDQGESIACARIVGVAPTTETKSGKDLPITYMSNGGSLGGLPAYVVGPVVQAAATVEIRFENGEQLRVPTFPAPAPLDSVRFYAAPLPEQLTPNSIMSGYRVKWVAGLDGEDNLIACLNPSTAHDSISTTSDCR